MRRGVLADPQLALALGWVNASYGGRGITHEPDVENRGVPFDQLL